MFAPRIILALFNGDYDAELGARAIQRYLEAHVETIADYLQAYPEIPLLYESGVRYRRQDAAHGQEDWHDAASAIDVGETDCKVLAAWRCAELRVRGVEAAIHLVRYRDASGKYIFHVQVKWPDGTIEDPSVVLGMNAPY